MQLERLNQELKRRTLVVGMFANAESCLRLVRALAVQMHENWLAARATSHGPSERAQKTSSPSYGRLTADGAALHGAPRRPRPTSPDLPFAELDAHNSALSRLRARCWSGGMAVNNRRSEHPICHDANKQENRDHDRRNEVFHGSFFLKTGGEIQRVAGKAACPYAGKSSTKPG